ncbi:hypothetical protein B0H10DRAFT_2046694, partial [Mycena sp. CBHHK59/15]
ALIRGNSTSTSGERARDMLRCPRGSHSLCGCRCGIYLRNARFRTGASTRRKASPSPST